MCLDLDKMESDNLSKIMREMEESDMVALSTPKETKEDLMRLRRERLGEALLFLIDKAFYTQQAKAKWSEVFHGEEILLKVEATRIS